MDDFKKLEKETKDSEKKEKAKKDAILVENILDLEVLDSKGLGQSDLAAAKLNLINKMIDEQYEKVEGTVIDPADVPVIEDVEFLEKTIPLAFAGQFDTYTTSQQVTSSCGTVEVGQISGYVNQFSQHSYIKMTTHDYPDTLHCPNYDYKDTTGQYTKVGVGGSCGITFANNDASVIVQCNNIGTNNDPLTYATIFITANSYYDWGWLPFTALNGWTTIVYHP